MSPISAESFSASSMSLTPAGMSALPTAWILKDLWVVGLDERGEQTYDEVDYKMHCAIVLGAEGKGLHDLVRRHCDFLVSIPMLGKVPSLNVSVAAGVVLYEVVRQRRQAASRKS